MRFGKFKPSLKVLFLLLSITTLGAYLRFVNISPYKFYPDSYQNLVVAENITTYGSVAGALGPEGAPYPPYFMWSRPIYPIFINLANVFLDNLALSAQVISFLFGVFAVVATYFLIVQIFENRIAGITGAFLLATSFNHSVWSGFIMSDTTGVFFLILFFNFLYLSFKKSSEFAEPIGTTSGALFAVAVFSRYEYLIFAGPVLFLCIQERLGKEKYFNLIAGFLIGFSLMLYFLFPVNETLKLIFSQNKEFILLAIVSLALLLVGYKYIYPYLLKKTELISKLFIYLAVISLFLKFQGDRVFNIDFPVLLGLINFISTDIVLVVLGLLGISFMLTSVKYKGLGFFLIFSILIMEVVYFKLNPLQQRYHTHLIIFFLIGVGYLVIHELERLRKKNWKTMAVFACLIFLLIQQLVLTQKGIKGWHNGDWFKASYEETSARTLKGFLSGDEIIIAGMPEAYHFFTGNSVRSLEDEKPYVYLEDLSKDHEIVIVNDLAMKNIFPNFYKYIEENLANYKVTEYLTNTNYRYRYNSEKENSPIKIYKLKTSELQL